MANRYQRITAPHKSKGSFERPEQAGNFDNQDDFNFVKSINILQGTINHTPSADKDIANKKYVDDNAGGAEINDLTAAVTWANVPDANITEASVTQHEAAIDHDNLTNTHNLTTDINHDNLTGFVANEHIDWTADQGATNINNANIDSLPIANTALVAGTNITLSTNTLNVDDAFLVNDANDITTGTLETTADTTVSGNDVFRNILIGTETSPGAASSYPQGTIYIQYTA